jgi:general secretion pathway protein C
MRDYRLASGVLLGVVLVAGCGGGGGGGEEAPKAAPTSPREAAVVKATVAAATKPTLTPTEVPATATPSPLPTSPPEPEASTEGLELLGIVRAGASPSAVISLDGRQEIFRKGDSVFDRGTIKEVREDSVVLHAGKEDLTLKLAKPAAEPPAAPPAEPVVESRPPAPEPPAEDVSKPLPRELVRSSLRDLRSVLDKAEAQRVAIGGGHGVQLGKVEPGSFLAKLGLRAGDVLQKLDGFPVNDPEHPPDLSSAAEGRELTIAFTRNDIGLTVTRRVE